MKNIKWENVPEDTWEILSPELTKKRKDKIEQVSRARTSHIALVLQDVANEHNVCACLRSAEAFGIQNVYVVNEKKNHRLSTVAKGSSSWLTVHNFRTIEECSAALKARSYKLAAAVPAQNSVPLQELELKDPVAVLFGNEHDGLSQEWKNYVDLYFTIPMFGFVESLNISVGAAITVQYLAHKAKLKLGEEKFFLSESERVSLLNQWAAAKIPFAYKKYQRYKSPSK